MGPSSGNQTEVTKLVTFVLILIYLLTTIGLTPSGSSPVCIYTQTVHRTTQLTTLDAINNFVHGWCGVKESNS